ncbi:MAG: hypothetical protein V3R94_03715 [Acidobacteriota bacterium]
MKYVNLAYVNLAFVVVGVIVVAYTFSVTFLSSEEILDQPMEIPIRSTPRERALENPTGASSENSGVRRSSGSQTGSARTPAEVRNPSTRPTSTRPTSTSRPPARRGPASGSGSDRNSRFPNVNAGRPPSGRATSRTFSSRPGAPSTRQSAQPGGGFVVTPSQGQAGDREKRSAPERSPNRPPVRGSLD